MGEFSWIDCMASHKVSPKNNIQCGQNNYSVLLPKELTDKILEQFPRCETYFNEYQNALRDTYYDGYGDMGGVDVYELIAFMNLRCTDKKTAQYILDNVVDKPKRESYNIHFYDFTVKELQEQGRTDEEIHQLEKAKGDEYFAEAMERYENIVDRIRTYIETGKGDNIRLLGIEIGCYDKQAAKLPYPLKVTHDRDIHYEEALFSPSDPTQGCGTVRWKELNEILRDRDKLIAQNTEKEAETEEEIER